MQFSMYSQLMDLTGSRIYADLFDELNEQTSLCEEAGFHYVWVDKNAAKRGDSSLASCD